MSQFLLLLILSLYEEQVYLSVSVNYCCSICSKRTKSNLIFPGAPSPLPSITVASCEVIVGTNALAAFDLPPVLLPESVQPLVKISTNFQGIWWTHTLSCLSTEAPVPKLWPLHSWSFSLFIPGHAQVKYCLVIVQHPNSLTSVSRSCPSFGRCSFCFSPP